MDLNGNSAAARLMVTAEVDSNEVIRSSIHPYPDTQNMVSRSSLSQAQADDYYEVISADGSIGADDISDDDIIVSEDTDTGYTEQTDDYSLNDLPFVPKFAFSNDIESNVDDEPPSNEILHVNRKIPHRPISRFNHSDVVDVSVPPPIFDPSVPPPNFNQLNQIGNEFFSRGQTCSEPVTNALNLDHIDQPFNGADVGLSENQVGPQVPSSSSQISPPVSVPDQGLCAKSSSAADWLDENGDPIKGAFDNINPDEPEDGDSDSDLKGAKIEYVYSVREKKLVPVKCEESSDGALINSTVSLKNIAGNLGLLESQLATQAFYNTKVIDADEEKKLYEASKSGAEYKAALQAAAATTSGVDTAITRGIPENGSVKKERFNRFKRNRFTDKKEETEVKETVTEEANKSQEDVALESQAVTEILREVQRGAARAKEHGALGWQKCPVPVTNKTFLRNTLVSTLREPYRPPNKRGRFHVGLYNKGKGKDHDRDRNDDDSSSRSSRSSRSYSSSRSGSTRSSQSRSGSSYSSDDSRHSRSRGGQRRRGRGGGRGGWAGQDQYYDEAWAAYAAQYGYPWYGPEAYAMYYENEGWPMDAYAAMYYGDPQAWAEYEAYYGSQHFNARGRGRGMRGRGRGRGCGRGGYPDDFRDYERDSYSRSPDYGPSGSRDARSHSWSPEYSRSRSRSRSKRNSSRDRSRSGRSRSRVNSDSRSQSREYNREKSPDQRSSEKNVSDLESTDKKRKKRKKKKKHKSKKSKHKRKDNEDGGDEDPLCENEEKKKQEIEDESVNDRIPENRKDVQKDKRSEKNVDSDGKKERLKKRKKHKIREKDTTEGRHRNKEKNSDEQRESEEKRSKIGNLGKGERKRKHLDAQLNRKTEEKGDGEKSKKGRVQEERVHHEDEVTAEVRGEENCGKVEISKKKGKNQEECDDTDGQKQVSSAKDDEKKGGRERKKTHREDGRLRKEKDETKDRDISGAEDNDSERDVTKKDVERESNVKEQRNESKESKHRESRDGSRDREKKGGRSKRTSRHKEGSEDSRDSRNKEKDDKSDSPENKEQTDGSRESRHQKNRDHSEESGITKKRESSEESRNGKKKDVSEKSKERKKRDINEDDKRRDSSRDGKMKDDSRESKDKKKRDDSRESKDKKKRVDSRDKKERDDNRKSRDEKKKDASPESRHKRDVSREGREQEDVRQDRQDRRVRENEGAYRYREMGGGSSTVRESKGVEKRSAYREIGHKDEKADDSSHGEKEGRERTFDKKRYEADRRRRRDEDEKVGRNKSRSAADYFNDERGSRDKLSHTKLYSDLLTGNKERVYSQSSPKKGDYEDLRIKLKRSKMQAQNSSLVKQHVVYGDRGSNSDSQASRSEENWSDVKRMRGSNETSVDRRDGNTGGRDSYGKVEPVKIRKTDSSLAENDRINASRTEREKQSGGKSTEEKKMSSSVKNSQSEGKIKRTMVKAKAGDADKGIIPIEASEQNYSGATCPDIDRAVNSASGSSKRLGKKVVKRKKNVDSSAEPKPVVMKKKKVMAKKKDLEGEKCEGEVGGLKKKKTKIKVVKKKVKKVPPVPQGMQEKNDVVHSSDKKLASQAEDDILHGYVEQKRDGKCELSGIQKKEGVSEHVTHGLQEWQETEKIVPNKSGEKEGKGGQLIQEKHGEGEQSVQEQQGKGEQPVQEKQEKVEDTTVV